MDIVPVFNQVRIYLSMFLLETRAFSTGPVENACIKLLKPLNLEVIVLQCEFLTTYTKVSLDF